MSKKLNKKTRLIIIIIAVVLAIIIIPTSIFCAVKQVTPAQMVTSVFVNYEEKIVGKWQNEAGSSAYEFYENGTYDCYFSTFSYSGDYRVDNDELTLSNPNNDGTVVYKIKIKKDTLSLKVYKQAGMETNQDEEATVEYKRVEKIQMKTLSELLESVTSQSDEETTDE